MKEMITLKSHSERMSRMNKKVAVICANGCEEIETLTLVDVLRRLNVECELVGLNRLTVMGAHDIVLTCDRVLTPELVDYQLVALPGGGLGATNLTASDALGEIMQKRHELGRWNAAICAAPKALARFGLLNDAHFTNYPGVEAEFAAQVHNGTRHADQAVVIDEHQKIITSRGPATSLAYAYAIAQTVCGCDVAELKAAMQYDFLQNHFE